MILSDNGQISGVGPAAEAGGETSEPAILRFTRLFKRDLWCWVNALQKLWWLFAIFPLLFAVIFFFFRTMTTSSVYVANCGLIRQEVTDTRSGILPPGYVNVQKSIIINLFKSRAVLEETVKRLSLPYTAEQLFNNIEVKTEKNSDYYVVSAKSKDPTIAATLSNTLSDVFIDEYKKLIRKNLEDLNDSYVRTQNEMEKQQVDLNERLKSLSAENNLTTIDSDIAFNNQRLLYIEDQLAKTSSTLDSAKEALYELQGELANTDEEIVSLREKSTAAEDELTRAQATLNSYEQMYASHNPILIQQREFVRKLKEAIEKAQEEDDADSDMNSKVSSRETPPTPSSSSTSPPKRPRSPPSPTTSS